MGKAEQLEQLLQRIRDCRICRDEPEGTALPHQPRPVFQISNTAQIAICGQAPGTRVHRSGRPFTDPSGDRLRLWMGVDEELFYDDQNIAIIPMGFCFPGLNEKGGDLPPRKECAAQWRQTLFEALPQFRLILLVGSYAIKWHLPQERKRRLNDVVAEWQDYVARDERPLYLPLPHPSWRNNHWLKKNPWFERDYIPQLQQIIRSLL